MNTSYDVFCFFFQAEDGIRDIGVTVVQTCALPICGKLSSHALLARLWLPEDLFTDHCQAQLTSQRLCGTCADVCPLRLRSEARRVGTECRSGWWPYH